MLRGVGCDVLVPPGYVGKGGIWGGDCLEDVDIGLRRRDTDENRSVRVRVDGD